MCVASAKELMVMVIWWLGVVVCGKLAALAVQG
jgi:hypothetical protein